jgi:type IV pilus assembly protein PilC
MARHGTLFSATHLGLIRSGETGGFLAEALDEIATGLEMEYELRAHLIANSWYFGLLFIVVAVVLPILLALIWMPKDLDYNLPNFLRYCLRYFYRVTLPILVGPLVVLVLAQQLFSRPTWETWRQRQVLRLPVVGGLAKKAALARFTRTLSVLWAGGVPLAQAVEDAASATGNATIIGRLRAMLPDLQHGGTLSDGMAGTRLFHRDVISMVVTGEQAGDLPTMLDRVAHFYRADLDSAIRVLPRVLLMILYVVSSALVLAMVAALYLAVYARIFAEAEKLMP